MAEGTAIAQPIRLREVLGTLRETRGGAVTLTEKEIAEATLDLARIGIYVEPTSAQAAAAFAQAAGDRDDHAGADDGAGDDGNRV